MKEKYFSHDANARSDQKMIRLRRRYGMEGYGVYFALLEMMFSEPDNKLPYTDEQFDAIAYELHAELNVGEMVSYCVDIGLFATDEEFFWSESFLRRKREVEEKTEKRTQRASNAAIARWSRVHGEGEGSEEKPTEGHPEAAESEYDINDAEYMRFARAYEANLGSLPVGKTMETLNSYFEDMGADVLILAVEQTNLAGAISNPEPFILKVLKSWADAGVDSVEKAKAQIKAHERAVKARNGPQEQKPVKDEIGGKFW